MINNEQFLEVSKKFIKQKLNNSNVEQFLDFVEQFQKQRLERLASTCVVENNLFAEYLSPALNEMIENQQNKHERFMFESMAQHYTNSVLVALKNKMQKEVISLSEEEKEQFAQATITEKIEKLLNHEKKNGHKFHNVIHDYIKDSQEYLYDHEKLALRGRSMPSIAQRANEIQKNKEDKKFNMQELEHPKLDAQEFEREMKMLLKGDIGKNHIDIALRRLENFQLGFISNLKKKVVNPTGSTEKLVSTIPELGQLKALKDWSWEEQSVNVMAKVLKTVQKSGINLEHTTYNQLSEVTEKLDLIMLDIGSFKKYNQEVKAGLLESLNDLKTGVKVSNSMKM